MAIRATFGNLHVKTDRFDSVAEAITEIGCVPAYINEEKNGWVSVYPRALDISSFGGGIDAELYALALAKALNLPEHQVFVQYSKFVCTNCRLGKLQSAKIHSENPFDEPSCEHNTVQ